ncbi:MAG: hypothetical protein ACOYN9_14610 [Saprospiraceae bacterium]
MKNDIFIHLDNPKELERLYRQNKTQFKQSFLDVYPQIKDRPMAQFWKERLEDSKEEIQFGSKKELIFVLIAALIAGLIAKIPSFTSIEEEFFYSRNLGFIVFPTLIAYFSWKNNLGIQKWMLFGGIVLISLIFINLFPNDPTSDTLTLSCLHLLLFLWSLLGFSFVGEAGHTLKRLDFLRFNGDFVVMFTLILIAGGITTGITIGLFSLIGYQIENFYFDNVVVVGLAAVPLVATFLTQTNPQLVSKVSPVIARIFSPIVLVMLVIYLFAIFYSGKDPYNDRDFLLLFNALLIGVMAIIFFSVAEATNTEKGKTEKWILFLLSVVTILVNAIALSAILFRISTWGITPNRLAVLGSNIFILINLLLVTIKLFGVVTKKSNIVEVGGQIAIFLPVYVIWTSFVTFILPFLFNFE